MPGYAAHPAARPGPPTRELFLMRSLTSVFPMASSTSPKHTGARCAPGRTAPALAGGGRRSDDDMGWQ